MERKFGKCAKCPFQMPDRICRGFGDKGPAFCSTKLYPEVIAKANREYEGSSELRNFAYMASKQEAECYSRSSINPKKFEPLKCRIQEIIEFCGKMGYHRIGLAFCIGLAKEAMALNRILESHGLEVVSVVCKAGSTDKGCLGICPEEKIAGKDIHESMCNPVAQAMILNEEKTQFNLLLGLCVGHDSMFIRYSEAPITVVAVKDRLLGHNPLAALSSNYYSFLEKPADPKPEAKPAGRYRPAQISKEEIQ